ncbi:MAG: PKD domain-containing protein [Bacteroidia bacterium]|nr:PKD domain-containing protein [Bacteroidia bacterium]
MHIAVLRKMLLAALLIILSAASLKASHFMGVDITYECTGPCTYRIYHKTYYDCSGAAMAGSVPVSTSTPPPAPGTGDVTFTGAGNCTQPTQISNWVFVSYDEVTPICPTLLSAAPNLYPTNCEGNNPNPPLNGVAEVVYYADFNFCNVNCTQYTIGWGNCCRNGAIDSGAGNEGIFSGSTVINLNITPCNSSPTFNNPPVPYICSGDLFTFNQGATDPDGDSLSYELGNCFNTQGAPVTYNTGFSPAQPLGPTWIVSINGQTGDITMTPNPSGSEVVGVMCIVVKEWRNGVLIGQVTRDMQITVIGGCQSGNPVTGGIQDVIIGDDDVPAFPLSYNEARVCAGVNICFDIPVIPQDTSLNYTITWNQGIPGATFTDAANPAISNVITGPSPIARFCWTPPANAAGAYYFVVSVNDDGCPVPGFNQFTIIIYVDETLAASSAAGIPIGCNLVQLTALPQSTIPSLYNNVFPVTNWTGNGNLNFNPFTSDSSFQHLYPAPNTYSFTLQLEDTFGCKISIPGVVNLTTGATANAGPDVTICSSFPFTLGTPAIPGQSYTWSPDTIINNTGIAQPTFEYPNDSLTISQFNYIVQVTDGVCTTFDYVSVVVNPALSGEIIPAQPAVCIGDSVTLTAIGNLSAGYTYLWSTGDTTASITVGPTTPTTYSVVMFNNGCSSSPIEVTVDVKLGPEALVSGDLNICVNEGTTLTAAGGVNYLWSAGFFVGNSITLASITQDSTVLVVAFDSLGCPGLPTAVTISPYPAPVPDFVADSVCEKLSTSFTDASSLSAGNIVSWKWDFGDGSPVSTANDPQHAYATPGTYTAELAVVTDVGCRDSVSKQIVVHPTPDADFTFTNVCEGLPNQFSNTTTIEPGGIVVNYTWDYGDNTPQGTGPNSGHVYDTFGYYNVTLTALTNFGCADNQIRTVFTHPNPEADFRVISACEDSLVLASTASVVGGNLDYISALSWDFGDDPNDPLNFSNAIRPTHIYDSAGEYLISLTVTTDKGCTDDVQRVVSVYPEPTADFRWDNACENAVTEFYDQTQFDSRTPLARWFWDFGDGVTTENNKPTHTYAASGYGTYTVTLGVMTNAGCLDTIRKEVFINPYPRVLYSSRPVCLYDSVPFTNLSTIPVGRINSWDWAFGDNQTSILPSPQHRYAEPGRYDVILVAYSDSGCYGNSRATVDVFPLPTILQVQEDTVCFSESARLTVITPRNTEVRWYYAVDDSVAFYTDATYITPPLPFSTTYYAEPVSDRGCVNTRQAVTGYTYPEQDQRIEASADKLDIPLAVVDFSVATSIGLTDWLWDFGDGNTSQVENPTHEYAYPGIYEVSARTTDLNGCEQVLRKLIEVRKVKGIWLPSAFTPNGDGTNDEYRVGHYNVGTFQISIFNRWGDLVFSASNPDFTWNGQSLTGGQVPEGVYVVQISATDIDGNDLSDRQTLTVVR